MEYMTCYCSRWVRVAPIERETRVKRIEGNWIKQRGKEENNAGEIMVAYTPRALERYFKGPLHSQPVTLPKTCRRFYVKHTSPLRVVS